MKTESDILLEILGDKLVSLNATFLGQTAVDPYINISAFPLIYEAMKLYSDQQNKEKDAEIQRLTKELELCQTGNADLQFENTRLRELLGKTMPHVQTCEGSDSKLLAEIDNALNHKP